MRSRNLLILLSSVVIAAGALVSSCGKNRALSFTPVPFVVPPGFPPPAYDFQADPITEEGFQLGKKLFYEGRLSADGAHSCNSCHQQPAAFTTYQHDRSHGYGNSHTLRNAPGLANLAWFRSYFLDGQYDDLRSVVTRHISHPQEMGSSMDAAAARLSGDAEYANLFRAAYGNAEPTGPRIADALRQFLLSLVVADSKYDRVRRGAATFDAQEAAGYAIFRAKCTSCHSEPLLSGNRFYNIGLPIDPSLRDYGRMRVTGDPDDSLKFRIPDLHNLPLTSYYAHDGRFSDMRLHIRHYSNGVQAGPTTDPLVAGGIPLSTTEEDRLIDFLNTLTDTAFMNNPRFKQ
ncbi:MAG: cytochrome-c peroxidase [Chitinophagaceae bacterium]|nr:MAG: cytochrome-c peroxidase [Chitinophagaceae bacterium]